MAKTKPRSPRSASRAPRLTGLITVFLLGFALAFVLGTLTSGPDATERRIAELEQRKPSGTSS
ncbi:hypothetical protein LZG04_27655 [Saccharothrix sp. S26]|uniref:hypothetical protein n=1 Tax=Saccharothrix sp. S26 TaxID=2907215 RepID=UPI001F3C60B1|nr:hypothetical protein [Saccharothrix sp. S26]MCE6998546.1 hypothetical protein [Saccharothrix sp. S26]